MHSLTIVLSFILPLTLASPLPPVLQNIVDKKHSTTKQLRPSSVALQVEEDFEYIQTKYGATSTPGHCDVSGRSRMRSRDILRRKGTDSHSKMFLHIISEMILMVLAQ